MDKIDPAAWFTAAACGVTLMIMLLDQVRWKRHLRAWRIEIEEERKAALARK